MKIADKQQGKSKNYLTAVLALRDTKDILLRQKSDTLAMIATIRVKLEDIDTRMSKTVDVNARKTLRTEYRELQEALEDSESVKLDIFSRVKALNDDLHPLRMAAWDELDAFNDIAHAEIEAIKEKAREDVLDVQDEMAAHPFQMADRIIENIIGYGGWQTLNGGQMGEPVKHVPSKDGPDRLLNDKGYGEVRKKEGHEWVGVARMFGNSPGK